MLPTTICLGGICVEEVKAWSLLSILCLTLTRYYDECQFANKSFEEDFGDYWGHKGPML